MGLSVGHLSFSMVLSVLSLCYLDHCQFVIYFEIRTCDASSFAIILKIDLVICGPLWLCMNFRIAFSISMKNAIGILRQVALNM